MGRQKGHPGMGQMADVASGREDGSREETDEECGGHGVGEMGRKDGVQSRLGQRGKGLSGYVYHSHDVGIARPRSPACHHNHQVPNMEEATELSWGKGR